jgi:hypothetical protein
LQKNEGGTRYCRNNRDVSLSQRRIFSSEHKKKIEKGLKGTTLGLTLERSYLEDYLKAVCKLFEYLAGVKITI